MDIRLSAVANEQLNALPEETRKQLVTEIHALLPDSAETAKSFTIDELDGEVRVLAVPEAHTSIVYKLTEPDRAIILSMFDQDDLPAPRRPMIPVANDAGASVKIGQQVLSHLE